MTPPVDARLKEPRDRKEEVMHDELKRLKDHTQGGRPGSDRGDEEHVGTGAGQQPYRPRQPEYEEISDSPFKVMGYPKTATLLEGAGHRRDDRADKLPIVPARISTAPLIVQRNLGRGLRGRICATEGEQRRAGAIAGGWRPSREHTAFII